MDLHEACGRTKLYWLMALADSKTLKAMVEFRDSTKGLLAASMGTLLGLYELMEAMLFSILFLMHFGLC